MVFESEFSMTFFYAMKTDPFLLSNRIHSLKYLRSTTLGSKDVGFKKLTDGDKDSILLFIFVPKIKTRSDSR